MKILKISPHRTGWDPLESDAGIAEAITLDRTQGTTNMKWSEALERGKGGLGGKRNRGSGVPTVKKGSVSGRKRWSPMLKATETSSKGRWRRSSWSGQGEENGLNGV